MDAEIWRYAPGLIEFAVTPKLLTLKLLATIIYIRKYKVIFIRVI